MPRTGNSGVSVSVDDCRVAKWHGVSLIIMPNLCMCTQNATQRSYAIYGFIPKDCGLVKQAWLDKQTYQTIFSQVWLKGQHCLQQKVWRTDYQGIDKWSIKYLMVIPAFSFSLQHLVSVWRFRQNILEIQYLGITIKLSTWNYLSYESHTVWSIKW